MTDILRCRAPHPGAERHPDRWGGKEHAGKLFTALPFPVQFVGFLDTLEDRRPGHVAVSCPARDCRTIHEYRPVGVTIPPELDS